MRYLFLVSFPLLAVLGCIQSNDNAAVQAAQIEKLSALQNAYYEIRDARTCATLDQSTVPINYWTEVELTEKLLFSAWQQGLGDEVAEVKRIWEENDAVTDKICDFQTGNDNVISSIEQFQIANKALAKALSKEK